MSDLAPMMGGGLGGAPALPPPSRTANLTRKQKAAIIVRLLSNEGADVPLAKLEDDLQAELTKQMGQMRYVDRTTLAEVVSEFADELDSIGLAFPGGLAGALTALDGKISPQTAARLRKEAGVRQAGDPWDRIRELPVPRLKAFLDNEATEISAVLLSKIETTKAAELLSALPGPDARKITYAVSLTKSVTPDAVERIGISLAAQLDNDPVLAFDTEPPKRVGGILNYANSKTRDALLSELEDEDQDFATEVRKNIFTFADIPSRIAPMDSGGILRGVDQAEIVRAFAYANANGMETVVRHFLDNVSKRIAEGIEEEIAAGSVPKDKEGEAAMSAIVREIRLQEEQGQLVMLTDDDDDE